MLKFTVLFLLGTALFAAPKRPQPVPGCPAVLYRSRNYGPNYVLIKLPVTAYNTSDKDISALKVDGEFVSPFKVKIPFDMTCDLTDIKVKKHDSGSCNTGIVVGTSVRSATMWIKQIAFADGTTWVDDGERKCSIVWEWKH